MAGDRAAAVLIPGDIPAAPTTHTGRTDLVSPRPHGGAVYARETADAELERLKIF
jgi:hypothetical protein